MPLQNFNDLDDLRESEEMFKLTNKSLLIQILASVNAREMSDENHKNTENRYQIMELNNRIKNLQNELDQKNIQLAAIYNQKNVPNGSGDHVMIKMEQNFKGPSIKN